jgi:hypothetical protein
MLREHAVHREGPRKVVIGHDSLVPLLVPPSQGIDSEIACAPRTHFGLGRPAGERAKQGAASWVDIEPERSRAFFKVHNFRDVTRLTCRFAQNRDPDV